jgi:hypothetical protein
MPIIAAFAPDQTTPEAQALLSAVHLNIVAETEIDFPIVRASEPVAV